MCSSDLPGIDSRTRFRHYVNIGRMERRLRRLMGDFSWGRMDDIFLRPAEPAAAAPVARLAVPC